jgi:hypothetical protein
LKIDISHDVKFLSARSSDNRGGYQTHLAKRPFLCRRRLPFRADGSLEEMRFQSPADDPRAALFIFRSEAVQLEEFAASQPHGDFRRLAGAGCRERVGVHLSGGLILSYHRQPDCGKRFRGFGMLLFKKTDLCLHAVRMQYFAQNGAISCNFLQNCKVASRIGIFTLSL